MALNSDALPFGGRFSVRLAALLMAALTLAMADTDVAVAKPDISSLRVDQVGFDTLPGWEADDHAAAFAAFLQTCRQPNSVNNTLAAACREALRQPATPGDARAREFFERHFAPHRVLSGSGLLTGYYEPVLKGSRVRTKIFSIPIYRKPADLVALNSREARSLARRSGLPGGLTYARRAGGRLEPYMTREQIEQGGLADQKLELVWLADAIDTFFLHIQGSGIVELPDGERMRIGFDGKNGYDYSSVGKVLVQAGVLDRSAATLNGVKNWLRANPEQGRRAMWRNKSFIFFREIPNKEASEGPIGAAGVPLVGGRSLAVDLRHYRLGLPIYISLQGSPTDKQRNLRRLMIAQDTGTAIKGPQRGDIFWGSGNAAGDVAGGTYHRGDFFVLLPVRARKAMMPTFTMPGTDEFVPFKTVSY